MSLVIFAEPSRPGSGSKGRPFWLLDNTGEISEPFLLPAEPESKPYRRIRPGCSSALLLDHKRPAETSDGLQLFAWWS